MIEYLIIMFLSFPPLLWFRDGYVLLGHDSGFRWDYLAQLPNLFYSWDPKLNFGVDWTIFKGFLITQFPEIFFSAVTGSFAWGQKLALIFWFALTGICMLYFLRALFPQKAYRFFRIFTSIFYMYNYFILDGWTIGERAKFSLYAALPIGLLLLYKVMAREWPVMRTGILFCLLYFFLNGGGVLPLYGATFVVLGLAFIYFARRKPLSFTVVVFFSFLIPFLFLNAYYILPNMEFLRSSYSGSVGGQGGIEGLIAWERVISAHASALNIVRLQGMPSIYNNPWQPFTHVLLTNPVFIALSFVPIIVILIGLIFFWPKHRVLQFLIFLLPLGLVLTMGTHPPTGILYEFAMKKIPGFAMFRSSFYKFAPTFWLPMIVLTGYFVNVFLLKFRKKIVMVAQVILVGGLLFYHYPFFTSEMFALSGDFSTRVKVPDYLKNITSEMKQYIGPDETTVIMPKMKEFSPALTADMYNWEYFSLDRFPRNAIDRRFIANDSSDPVVSRLYDALYSGNSKVFLELARILGIDYVLWRGDAIRSGESTIMAQKILDSDSHVARVYETGLWALYRINQQHEGTVTATTQFRGYEGTEAGGAYLVETYGTVVTQGDEFLEAECIMCKEQEYEKLVQSITTPLTRITPGSRFFFFEEWRQKRLLEQVKDSPREKIDVDIALAQKYFAWGNIERGRSFMRDALATWSTLTGRDGILYAIRLKAYLDAQQEPISEELSRAIWMSEQGTYRYIASPKGNYTLVASDPHALVGDTEDDSGLHRIEVQSTVSHPLIFLRSQEPQKIAAEPKVMFEKINPTKYIAHVTADSRFLLILREHFDPRWKISIPGTHVQVNGFANGWIVDKEGEYNVIFYYEPQKYFTIGLIISSIAFLGSLYYLVRK